MSVEAPSVITGVLRPEPLRELSILLGVEVRDVRRIRVIRDGQPQPDDNAWQLAIPGRSRGDGWSQHALSKELRNPWWLNFRARIWGRDPSLPPLTKADGRRALRLMHEHIESKTDTKGMNDQ